METLLFVYGSLMRDRRHHDVLGHARFEREASIDGYALYRVGAYPAMAATDGARVRGEIYGIESRDLSRLDDFEDCPTLYQRERIRIDDGCEVWAYTMRPSAVRDATPIHSERWEE